MNNQPYKSVIIGAGPAGTGPLLSAMRHQQWERLLDSPIAVLDARPAINGGTIGHYAINSDTLGGVFLECLYESAQSPLGTVLLSDAAQILMQRRDEAVPLSRVGDYMAALGKALQSLLDAHPKSHFFAGTHARSLHLLPDNSIETRGVSIGDNASRTQSWVSQTVVLALGGSQNRSDILRAPILPNFTLADTYVDKVLLSDTVLQHGSTTELQRRFKNSPTNKVVIIGGSHSALSAAWRLLHQLPDVTFEAEDITIVHRRPIKLFYLSRENARADGYTDFTEEDICPVTQRVNRLGGMRLDSRQLLRQIWGMVRGEQERRVRLVQLAPDWSNATQVQAILDEATLIIPAFGYQPNVLPVYDHNEQLIELLSEHDRKAPLVDEHCRVLAADGTPIPQLYGMGLASGFRLSGSLGGEPSFTGQTNGVWLYQHGVGEIVLQAMLGQPRDADTVL